MAAPVNTAVPTIDAKRFVGETLTGVAGEWTGEDSTALQWERAAVIFDGGLVVVDDGEIVIDEWVEIDGETSLTHVIDSDDYGCLLRLREDATNGDGTTSAYSAESDYALNRAIPESFLRSTYDTFSASFAGTFIDDEL